MILPTKHISEERALLHIGAEILETLKEPKTVSRLWNDLKLLRRRNTNYSSVTFDWFILALDFLYIIGAIEFRSGYISKSEAIP